MGAWSKSVLGWVDVVEIPEGTDLTSVTLDPVETAGTVYKVWSGDGSGEYFLLENRQRIGFDQNLQAPGLLVWQIDPDWVAATWPRNQVNAGDHMGVWLRQADGLDQLGQQNGNRGDAGDPFPFNGRDAFHAGSRPGSWAFQGTPTGVTLLNIRRADQQVSFDVMNRMITVTLGTDGADGDTDILTVNEVPVRAPYTFVTAAFTKHEVAAAAGEHLAPGVRRPFLSWMDDSGAARTRTLVVPLTDTELVARYGGREVELAMDVQGGVNGIGPGTFKTVPASDDLWFAEGTELQVEAVPLTGFSFLEWSGALSGQGNPAHLTVTGPVQAGASFELIYDVPDASISVEAARVHEVNLTAEHANPPVTWTVLEGSLPPGMNFQASGRLAGAPMRTGTYPLTVQARDGIGLTGQATVTVEVTEPELSMEQLASAFLTVGEPLTSEQRIYLDHVGNGNATYDLGDLRAWVLAHPDLPVSAAVQALLGGPVNVKLDLLRRGGR